MLSLRLSPVRQRRSTVANDIATLITSLGGDAVVPAFYDVRAGVVTSGAFVDAWVDARGAFGGPFLLASGSTRPTLSASGITFDGVDDFLRATGSGLLGAITGDCGLAIVSSFGLGFFATVHAGTATRLLAVRNTTGVTATSGATSATGATPGITSQLRVFHGRKIATGTIVGVKDGNIAEVTAVGAVGAGTADSLTVGATEATTPTGFSAFTVRAVVVFKGDYAGKQATVNTWAAANHGATL